MYYFLTSLLHSSINNIKTTTLYFSDTIILISYTKRPA
jgi:hypothetical protein